ncbi:hypothetical protein CMQ_7245 [Grosmannia clavigera kw1407]|uniref:2EXR domain-containing protein n=1 Tax=Grosmannia clavigera (strain kw1407 / UAMH 11150) TaxID=655863 RepID=F0XP15_GROCL|nr:uncharacterized protein CMQ_7245 [Grosmannia clavigera kw1407]EFX00243.1 hypothetical protein CMQ_7245 [Grosmannia clavigera kw1407]
MSTESVLDLWRFARLPVELRLRVWEAACPTPSMQLFDVCLPPELPQTEEGGDSALREFVATDEESRRCAQVQDAIFFDQHRGEQQQTFPDPSMYRQRMRLEAVCFDASLAVALPSLPRRPGGRAASTSAASPSAGIFTSDVNTVYLPGPRRLVHYNNQTDVLHLCFPQRENASSATTGTAPRNRCTVLRTADSGNSLDLGSLLGARWSDEAAETIRTANRIALDAGDMVAMISKMASQDLEDGIMFLACMLQQHLEVLYLVDYCVGRCQCCGRQQLDACASVRAGGTLRAGLHGNSEGVLGDSEQQRQPDVIWGVKRTYREVLDLERLRWTSSHLAYQFARAIGDAIREQQAFGTQPGQFQGVRVLVAEDQ